MIRKEVKVSGAVIKELKRIITESEITKENDEQWPEPDRDGEQNLEIKIGNGATGVGEEGSVAPSRVGWERGGWGRKKGGWERGWF